MGKAGMEKRVKANMTLAVALPGGVHPDESICKRKPDEQVCFGGIDNLHVQVMENSEKVLVAVMGHMGQACSVVLKYSVIATSPVNESEGVFTMEDREDGSELWIESNLDRESVMTYNFSIVCSVMGDNGSVDQFVLPGVLTVLDQDDNSPMIASNTTLRTVSIPLHSGKNIIKETRLEPEGGHTTLSFVDADTPDVNNFVLEIVNDTKQLLAINFSSIHSIPRDFSSYCFVVLKAELRTSSIIGWDGMYCVLVNVNDTSLVGNHMDTKISFNVCLHSGIEPTTTKLPLQESEKVDCGPMCQVIIIVVFVGLAGGFTEDCWDSELPQFAYMSIHPGFM
ncbi:unnamed protein product [Allacma fusca]|uniref:Cadherin domain-containing protein n=1 Tax=Allacma fusca TaxID=39272 RepID=A0A8J2NTC1_9HEXA|nr:unnamed protein product [Allacma fusca]